MNAISIRRIDPELQLWLRDRAAKNGVSMEQEVRDILFAARAAAEAGRRARVAAALARATKLPPGSPSTTEIIRQMRDER